jgi:hypothetical protein
MLTLVLVFDCIFPELFGVTFEEKAEVLAAVEVDSDLPAVDSRTNHKLESIEITPDKVEKKLKDLKISK